MEEEQVVTPNATTRWSIDLDWYKRNNRSFSALAKTYLCAKCAKQNGKVEVPVARILGMIKDCCARNQLFMTHKLPIMDVVFRVFLANGNQPLTIDELRQQVTERLGGDTYRTSREMLLRLLRNDRHYGIREVADNPKSLLPK